MSRPAVDAIAIGASAGAVQALSRLLPPLPRAYPIPILVVVHVPPDRDNALVNLLKAKCQLEVKEAEDKESIGPGHVYLAPSDHHLLVEADRTLALSVDELVLYSRPSIDVLFESAADAFGPRLAGVVLTGANEDGAQGLRAIHAAGGLALIESPLTAYAPTMPAAALAACAQARALTIDALQSHFLELAEG